MDTTQIKKSPIYPFRLEPVYTNHEWGGKKIRTILDRPVSETENVSESWEVVDIGDFCNIVKNGPLSGSYLRNIAPIIKNGFTEIEPHKSVKSVAGDNFPLTFKYVDVQGTRPVHFHPTDLHVDDENGFHVCGRTKTLLVIDAEPDGLFYLGFKKQYTRNEVAEAIRSGSIVSLLNPIKPNVGDCFVIEPGTLHSVSGGVLFAETQRIDNVTLQLSCWEKTGREIGNDIICSIDNKHIRVVDKDSHVISNKLSIENVLDSINYDYTQITTQKSNYTKFNNCSLLVDCKDYIINRWVCDELLTWTNDKRYHIWSVLEGDVTAIFHMGRRITPEGYSGRKGDPVGMECLTKGDTLLVPNSCRSIQWTSDSDKPVVLLDIVGM
ncbi:MAG: class I mannose-6-phosphate isomerase [Thermoguttaceae bacterium]